MFRLVASVGADAPKSTINPDDEILTVLGGKASCRRKFVINVHLLDEAGITSVNEEFCIVASVAYAHDRSPIVQDENLFLAEPPLLTTFNGVEYPSQDRPTRLVGGKASFKLAISLLSSKYDNRLFCICFTPQFSSPSSELRSSPSRMAPPLCEPCYSKPIRSISRKRSSSSAIAPPMPHHFVSQPESAAFSTHPIKIKSPDSGTSEEVEKFFRVSSATSSSEEEDKRNCPNGGEAASDNGSLRYIASNNYKQEAQLLLGPDAVHSEPYYSLHDSFCPRRDPFTSKEGTPCESFLTRRDPLMQLETAHYEGIPSACNYAVDMGQHKSFSRACLHMDSIQHQYGAFPTREEQLLNADNSLQRRDNFSAKDTSLLLESGHHQDEITNKKDLLMLGGSYMDACGRLTEIDVLINGSFSPNPVTSRSESTSPISGILTSDSSIEHADAFSQPSPLTAAAGSQRPVSAPRPGSQLSSPFRPYNPHTTTSRVSPCEFQRSSSRSPSYLKGLQEESPDGLLLTNRPVSEQVTMAASSKKQRLDAVLQRFLLEATDANIENEEQSLLALEITLQDAIRELEKKKEELHSMRQRLLEDDKTNVHNIVFQSSSWVESLSRRFDF